MRLFLLSLTILIYVISAKAQTSESHEAIVTRLVDGGLYQGWDDKALAGTGDETAVLVTKILGDRHPTTANVEGALTVLYAAFSGVQPGPCRDPRTALFVLYSLEQSASDSEVKERIRKARQYVLKATSTVPR